MSDFILDRILKTGLTLRYTEQEKSTNLLETFGMGPFMAPASTNPNYSPNIADGVAVFSSVIGVPKAFVTEATCGLCLTLPIAMSSAAEILSSALAFAGDSPTQDIYRIASHFKDESCRPFLEEGLLSRSWDIRCQVLLGLGVLGSKESVPVVLGCLSDSDIDVVIEALSALSSIGVIPELVESGEMDKYLTVDHASVIQEALPYLIENDLDSAEKIFGFSSQEQAKVRLIASAANPSHELFVYLLEKFQEESYNTTPMITAVINSAPTECDVDAALSILDNINEGGWFFSAAQIILALLPMDNQTKKAVADNLIGRDLSDYDAKRARAIAVSSLDESRFVECGEKNKDLLTFGYGRLEVMFEFPCLFPFFDLLFSKARSKNQRNAMASILAADSWTLDSLSILASRLRLDYPESTPLLEDKIFNKFKPCNVRRSCAGAVLLSPQAVSISPILIRCLISADLGGPVEPTPENIGILLALLDDKDAQKSAAQLMRSLPSDIRMMIRAFSDYKEQVDDVNDGLRNASLFIGGIPQKYFNDTQYKACINSEPLLALYFNEKLSLYMIERLLNDENSARIVANHLLVDNEERDEMKSISRLVGASMTLNPDELANVFLAMANNDTWVSKEVSCVLVQHVGLRLLESTNVDNIEEKLIMLTADSDSDVVREAKKACDILGVVCP